MKSIQKLLFASCIALSLGSTSADPLGQQLTFTQDVGDTWEIDWTGVSGRTYFVQWSLDLETWGYLPDVDFETPLTPFGTNVQGADKYFVRLRYVDANWVASLQEAKDADFDGDGIPNYFEVHDLFSDPLDRDSNGGDTDNGGAGDGLSDGWELYFFGNLTTADPSAIGQADGLTNKEKSDLGLKPNTDYSDPNAVQVSQYNYDLAGRLTSVSAPVAAVTINPDSEGNILSAQ
ncbi:MAG: hypothetical protein ACSHX7_00505 [Luteolibacter sp.]